jgi:hypothetical protein
MTLMLGIDRLEGVISMRDAIDLLEKTLAHEALGRTSVSVAPEVASPRNPAKARHRLTRSS